MPVKDPFSHIIGRGRHGPAESALHLTKPGEDQAETGDDNPRLYRAYETAPRPDRLTIRRWSGACHSVAYGLLADIIFDMNHDGMFILAFNILAVTVIGRNLTPIIHAIDYGRARAITEFAKQAYDMPGGAAPFIERIEIDVHGALDDLAEQLKQRKVA